MTANPSKPKRHPLPRLWRRIADTLLLAKSFTLQLPTSVWESFDCIQALAETIPREPRVKHEVKADGDRLPIKFKIKRTIMGGRLDTVLYMEGLLYQEENFKVTIVTGKAYPSFWNTFWGAIITIVSVLGLADFLAKLVPQVHLISDLPCLLLIVFFSLLFTGFSAFLLLSRNYVFKIIDRNMFIDTFTHYLQTAASERAGQA
jgi:hypothetical protein